MDERTLSSGRSAGRNTPATPPPEDYPVAPLPPIVPDDQQPSPDTPDNSLPEGQPPIIVGPIDPDFGQQPEIPLPPIIEGPIDPDFGQHPVIPLPPIVGNPEPGYPPQYPVAPGPGGVVILPGLITPNFCTVRILNAAPGFSPFNVTVGRRLAARNLGYGGLSSYVRIADGFRTVTIGYPGSAGVFYQQAVPFSAGELITLAIVRSGGGLDLVRVNDIPCRNRPAGRACIRAINLCYGAPALDVLLSDGRMVFNDVRYKEVTNFKQARPRDYSFYVAQTSFVPSPYFYDIENVEDTPMAAPGYYLPGVGAVNPLASFYLDAKRNGVYSVYLLGTWNYASPSLRVRVVEDFQ